MIQIEKRHKKKIKKQDSEIKMKRNHIFNLQDDQLKQNFRPAVAGFSRHCLKINNKLILILQTRLIFQFIHFWENHMSLDSSAILMKVQ